MTSSHPPDPHSVAGKGLHVAERCELLVVGAGPAGLATAIEAAGRGLQVMLVDENPVPFTTMGEDVPLLFGGAMSALARNRTAMMEAYAASEPLLEEAFEAGVDVRLGTVVFGLYGNGESVGWLPGLVAGLADETRSWMVAADRVVVASGARDIGLAFPGWELPGVVGAAAALRLLTRYGALAATHAAVVGTTAEALTTAIVLHEAGIAVAALVEQADAPVGPDDLVERVRASGIEILTRHVVREAVGRDGVEAVLVTALGPDGIPVADAPERRIACDVVILGIGLAPVVELVDALGARVAYQAERGGYAPVLQVGQRASLPGIWVVGDAAGTWAAKTQDRRVAEREGRLAAADACGAGTPEASAPPAPIRDLAADRLAWVRASVVEARGEPHVCRCEEVTAREILEVRPPRYLGARPDRRNDRSLRSLLGAGPPHPDQVKRLTRAGMGTCQGRRCREQVACLLALGSGETLADISLASYRAPVRPLPLRLAGDRQEHPDMTAKWDTWFGIAPQYRLARDLEPLYTVAAGNPAGPVASE